MFNVSQQAQNQMTVNHAHAIQTTLGERLDGETQSTFMMFRTAHTKAGSNIAYQQTFTDADNKVSATFCYNRVTREQHVTVKALDRWGVVRDAHMYKLVIAGLETRHEWGEDWMLLLIPSMVEAIKDLYQSVRASLPITVDAR